jgi:hypothetical protein
MVYMAHEVTKNFMCNMYIGLIKLQRASWFVSPMNLRNINGLHDIIRLFVGTFVGLLVRIVVAETNGNVSCAASPDCSGSNSACCTYS